MIAGRACPMHACASPSQYPLKVQSALNRWSGPASGGSFVFTSSMSVCAVDDGGSVTEEHCPLVPLGKGPSTDRLLGAEQAVIQVDERGACEYVWSRENCCTSRDLREYFYHASMGPLTPGITRH